MSIDERIFVQYPDTTIGYLTADVSVKLTDPYVATVKQSLSQRLKRLGITAQNVADHPDITSWRSIYRHCGVKPNEYRSSVESLLRRVTRGQEIWRISNVVDLYNAVSVLTLLPMGGYDREKISGNLRLRYGITGESFHPLGSQETIAVHNSHIVYADDEKVVCWLWNHRDSRLSVIDEHTQHAVFFIDAACIPHACPVEEALTMLAQHLSGIGALQLASSTSVAHRWRRKQVHIVPIDRHSFVHYQMHIFISRNCQSGRNLIGQMHIVAR